MNEHELMNALGLRKEAGSKGRIASWLMKRLLKYPRSALSFKIRAKGVGPMTNLIYNNKALRTVSRRADQLGSRFIRDAADAVNNPKIMPSSASDLMDMVTDVSKGMRELKSRVANKKSWLIDSFERLSAPIPAPPTKSSVLGGVDLDGHIEYLRNLGL